MFVPRKVLEEKLRQLLAEDLGQGDVTTAAVVPPNVKTEAEVIAKENGIAAGIEEAVILSESLELKTRVLVKDGEAFKKNQTIIQVNGDAQTILAIERTMLNLLSRMSGIATATRLLVEKVRKAGSNAHIAATRKTAPGWSYFDKKAVFIGGGDTHRLHLDDMVLIKDNHIALAGNVEKAVRKAKENASFSKKIEVEVTRVEDVVGAAEAGADVIMLDNFTPKQIKEAVKVLENTSFSGRVQLEASGGINSKNIVDYASTQVYVMSIGELTHSVKALDISLEIVKPTAKGKKHSN